MSLSKDFLDFSNCITNYAVNRSKKAGYLIEDGKNNVVKKIVKRRGQFARPTVHLGMVGIAAGAMVGVSIVGSNTTKSATYQGVEAATPQRIPEIELMGMTGNTIEDFNGETIISEKPRDTIIEHEVKGGETISQIAQKYGIDTNTIKWANGMADGDSIKPGQKLKILPVTGVAHTVERGDTVYTIAKKYDANPQAIVDFPFNDIGENLSIRIGQILIVPDGSPPEKPKPSKAPVKVVEGPKVTPPKSTGDGKSKGSYIWPVRGLITQGFRSYHPALDIAGDVGTPIVAADGGEVIVSGWTDNTGYGNRIMIRHPDGTVTLYAHLQSNSNRVKVGDKVSQGQVIGLRGNTGRSTGPHLHFEIRRPGGTVNPANYLK